MFRTALSMLLAAGVLAAAATVPTAAWANPPKVLKKVPPEFPGEAARKGITEGVLKVTVKIDDKGSVSDVQVTEASPPKAKIFTSAAIDALKQWKFEASGAPQTMDLKLVFQQD